MKSNELRIGNLINDEYGNLFEIKALLLLSARIERIKDNENIKPYHRNIPYGKLKPIPLTGEWLIKLGFEKSINNFYVLSDLSYKDKIIYTDFLRWNELAQDNEVYLLKLADIEYIHELQNLYFALIGNELTLNN